MPFHLDCMKRWILKLNTGKDIDDPNEMREHEEDDYREEQKTR